MNAKTSTTLAPTADQIEKRIADERRQLLADQNLQINLEGQRLAPLEAGDDVALNRVEKQLAECIERQERTQERIELLQQRLKSTRASEEELADLALIEQAEALRQEGVKLIEQEYPKLAAPLVKLFERMLTIDSQIAALNDRMHDSSSHVSYPNSIRTIPSYTYDENIGSIRHGVDSPKHPRHGEQTRFDTRRGMVFVNTGEVAEPYYEPQIVKRHVHAAVQPTIPTAVKLPGIWEPK